MTPYTLDERPNRKSDESSISIIGTQLFWCCIMLFFICCSLALANWQALRNNEELKDENARLKVELRDLSQARKP